MEFHICEQLSLDQLCEHFSLSRSSIQKLFQKEKGCGPMEYFNGLKIQRAKDMIRDGRKNLTEIAGFLSYSSLPYFSKQFKNYGDGADGVCFFGEGNYAGVEGGNS